MTEAGASAPAPHNAVRPVVPGVVLAAPSCGAGTAIVATGLLAALTAAGSDVAPFTVGPGMAAGPGSAVGYGESGCPTLATGYRALAAGRHVRHLDPVLVGEHRVAPLYAHGSAGCDLAMIEGAMPLFDSLLDEVDPTGADVVRGSAAHVASLLGLPVVLVVDVRGYAQSLAAVVRGLAVHDPGTRIAGVILNGVNSDRHSAILTAACENAGVPVVGTIPNPAGLEVPTPLLASAVSAEQRSRAEVAVTELGRIVEDTVDLDALRSLAVRPRDVEAWDPVVEIRAARSDGTVGDKSIQTGDDDVRDQVTIAVVRGPIFTGSSTSTSTSTSGFAYAEYPELLAAAGARVVGFDPFDDHDLPAGTCGVVFPGGLSEERCVELGTSTELISRLTECVAEGMPVHVEGAGVRFLCASLPNQDHATDRFAPEDAHGYRAAVATTDSLLYRVGERVIGYESPRTREARGDGALAITGTPAWVWRDSGGARVDEGIATDRIHASYLRVHPAAHPEAMVRFVDAARVWGASQAPPPRAGSDADAS